MRLVWKFSLIFSICIIIQATISLVEVDHRLQVLDIERRQIGERFIEGPDVPPHAEALIARLWELSRQERLLLHKRDGSASGSLELLTRSEG